MIMGLLKWLDNNLERLLVDKFMTREYKMNQEGIQIIVPKKPPVQPINKEQPKQEKDENEEEEEGWIQALKSQQSQSNQKTQSDQHDQGESDEEESEEGSEGEEGEENNAPNSVFATTAHKGTQILAEGLKIEGIGILECEKLIFIVTCERCKTQIQVQLRHHETHAVECIKCHHPHIVTYRKSNYWISFFFLFFFQNVLNINF